MDQQTKIEDPKATVAGRTPIADTGTADASADDAPVKPADDAPVIAPADRRSHRIIRDLIFLVILCAMLVGLSAIVIPKTNVPKQGIHHSLAWSYYGEPENSLDVVFIGDSNAYNSISPIQLYYSYGFTSVVSGLNSQHMLEALYMLQDVLSVQSPQVVVLDIDSIFTWDTRPKLFDNNIRIFLSHTYPVFEYHDRWKSLTTTDFTQKPDYTWKMDTKGYNMEKTSKAYTNGQYMFPSDKSKYVDPVARLSLKAIEDTCKERGITLVLIDVPSAKSWTTEKHNAVQKLADEAGLTFIDMNLPENDPGIDWSTDTYDGGLHMNVFGATKVTAALGTYLSQNFDLPDHRSDPTYTEEWNSDLATYVKSLPDGCWDTVTSTSVSTSSAE